MCLETIINKRPPPNSTVRLSRGLRFCVSVLIAFVWLAFGVAKAQATTYALGTTALLVGPAAGSNSVVLAVTPPTGTWTAMTNAIWLHLSPANQSGTGSTNVVFSCDANSGATRTGTLTIGDQTLTVTQASSNYVAVDQVTTLASWVFSYPFGLALDGMGNVYIADTDNNAIKKWTASNNAVTVLVSSGLNSPQGVAVDGAGNVYIADTQNSAIKEWTPANKQVVTLVSSGLNYPHGVAVDRGGNLFIADTDNNAIKEWTMANSDLNTLVSSGLSSPYGVAVDAGGNVYIADTENNAIEQWTPASGTLSTLVSSGLVFPAGVAVDVTGNVYIADTDDGAIKKWSATSGNATSVVSASLVDPRGVAVDNAGNLYIADSYDDAIKELPRAFVDTTPRLEMVDAGIDSLPVVLPPTVNLLPPFAPASDQSWLTITGVENGVVSYSFSADTNGPRTAHITLLGQTISVTQGELTITLGADSLLEGPAAGSDSIVLAVSPPNSPWTATANDGWLHLSAANQSGAGSTNLVFSFDANPGPTRSGTLSFEGQTLTVTQAGATYVKAGTVTELVSSGLDAPYGVAVGGAGNVYIADTFNSAIKLWTPASNSVTTLISSGLNEPSGVAVSGAGNVFFSDTYNQDVKEWMSVNNTVIPLVSSGLDYPIGTAVDRSGNVYFSDPGNGSIKEWSAATSNVTTLVSSGLNYPTGVAVDAAGNIYVADIYNGAIKEWNAGGSNVVPLVASGLSDPFGVAVDGSGNVYFADTGNQAIKEWSPANDSVTNLISTGLSFPYGVAVDGAGNVYIADTDNQAIKELPRAFVDPTRRLESLAAGSDVLPQVLPARANLLTPFAPTSDEPWLTITGVTNGIVGYSFAATATNRTAHITLLGQSIPIMQSTGTPPILGSVQVTIGPPAAVSAGAQWRVDGGASQNSGATVSNLSVGNHTVSFIAVSGWMTPVTETVSIRSNLLTTVTGTYSLDVGALSVSISPAAAVAAGAQWRVDAGTLQSSGATVSNLAIGSHTVSFTSVDDWDTPSSQIVTIIDGQATTASDVYIPTYGSSNGVTFLTNGYGTIELPKNPAIGKKYSVTAVPKLKNVFVNWTGGTIPPYVNLSTSASYAFTNEANLVLEANFMTNVYLEAQGTYRGLFAPANSPRQQTNSGSFLFSVTSSGALSGRLNLASQTVPLSGKLGLDGAIDIVSKRANGEPSLTTTLQLDFFGQTVSGTVGDGSFTSQLNGNRDVFNRADKAAAFDGQYTVIIPGTNNPTVGPEGVSYGTVKVDDLGNITLSGSLADGTALSQSSVVSQDGLWPLYANLYGGKGSLWGWACFTNGAVVSAFPFSWINATNSSKTAWGRSGFTNPSAVLAGGIYIASNSLPANLTAIFGGGGLPVGITNGVTNSAADKISVTNKFSETNKLTLTITKATGLVSGTFANPANSKDAIKVGGVILQLPGQTNAQGYFIGTNQSGPFLLIPQEPK